MALKSIFPLVAFGSLLLVFLTACRAGGSKKLGLSDADYANGAKRSAAVFKKVIPGLKKSFAEKGLDWNAPIYIRAFKEEKTLELWVKKEVHFVLYKTYPILGQSGILGPKLRQGDHQVPEGFYFVRSGQMNPQSNYHLSFNIGYPNRYDRIHQRTGDLIMIHGSNVSIGCLAMGDEAIEEIYTLAHCAFEGGQPFFRVHLFPFRMSDSQMKKHADPRWNSFWRNLQQGYQWFEQKKQPPNVTVENKQYRFD